MIANYQRKVMMIDDQDDDVRVMWKLCCLFHRINYRLTDRLIFSMENTLVEVLYGLQAPNINSWL